MKNLKSIGVIFILLISTVFSFAQQTEESMTPADCRGSSTTVVRDGADVNTMPFIYKDAVKMQPVPRGEGAWTIQILTSGGIYGNGKGDLVFTSEGKISRDNKSLTEIKMFNTELFQSLTKIVSKLQISTPQSKQPKTLAEQVREQSN